VPPLSAVLLAPAMAAMLVDWAALWSGSPRGLAVERVAKPLVPLLLALAVLAWPTGPGPTGVRAWVVLALAASLVGDVLLLPPGRLVAGLVAFLVAHLAYLVAFALQPGEVAWLVAGVVVALAVAATIGRALVLAARRAGMAVPVAAYLVVILAMAIAATRTGEPAAIAGAWLFVTSDALLGWGTFRGGGERRPGRVAVIVTYHLAQLLLVVALVG
jgi:uncharacterized membrane protein YhhN